MKIKLSNKRQGKFIKDNFEETFIQNLNYSLLKNENMAYDKDAEIDHPIIFVFGAPRSGTTLLSQIIASNFDVGFINNLMARFYLTPVHGIHLSQIVLKDVKRIKFNSEYARTEDLTDIHEFGYFWRHWLQKKSFNDIVEAEKKENDIDWNGLRLTLANMQRAFKKGMVFKNIFGSYHLIKFQQIMKKMIYIYIERDHLDTAVSILDARKKYYGNIKTWWSYVPIEYNNIKDLDPYRQIAGQVFYLNRYYKMLTDKMNCSIKIRYKELVESPINAINTINELSQKLYEYKFKTIPLKNKFSFRTYHNRCKDKEKFEAAFNELNIEYNKQ
ncbi:MAG: sulfotransferase [bacterium]